MTLETTIFQTEVSFKDFLFKNKRNWTILWISTIAVLVQFSIFKYLYPNASFIHGDSFSYLKAADENLSINTYLIGYSKFLRLFSVFNRADYALTAFQYLFIQSSALYLLFTLFYFYKPGKVVQLILLCFIVCNPIFLHLANLISSDGFFLALSLFWFSLLLWIIHKPSIKIFIWHAIILFIAFTVRYNAMIYPIISIMAFLISKQPIKQKLTGISIGIVACLIFMGFTMYQYKQLTRHWQYSPFSGWQLTNNAMYAYRYVDSVDRKPVPQKFEILDNMIRQYFDSTHNTLKYPMEALEASTAYMWSPGSPMAKYKDRYFKNDTTSSDFKKWATLGPFFKEYGIYIIQKYPFHFIHHFIWPNSIKYYAPPIEFLSVYNSGKKLVNVQTMQWFGYRTQEVKTRMTGNKIWILNFYPFLSGLINVAILLTLICYLLLKGWKYNKTFKNGIVIGGGFWLFNALFTIGASSAALRFQAFPIILTTIIALMILDWMVQLLAILKKEDVTENMIKAGSRSDKIQNIVVQ